ncbi:putative oxidoreductase [Mucilaginibacter gracilis]|uniref:Putative oxidoreductase n=1 Tax=Mucilaginibacter gracilis TaxID=423350 RepID=A0A495IYN8_9SPHI|nr:DoxX family protein [Mucilaginibacter gracilis]RKR81815.1 putative oxidoreductase [Mucilaginibacter gracilis]
MAMLSNLGSYKSTGLLIMRLGLGIMFIYHGYPKLLGGPNEWSKIGSATKYAGIHFYPAFWGFMAACTETFGGFLLVIGLAFRPVCLLLAIELTIAALMHLGTGGGLMDASHAIEDAVVFAGLLFVGPGRFSVDKK